VGISRRVVGFRWSCCGCSCLPLSCPVNIRVPIARGGNGHILLRENTETIAWGAVGLRYPKRQSKTTTRTFYKTNLARIGCDFCASPWHVRRVGAGPYYPTGRGRRFSNVDQAPDPNLASLHSSIWWKRTFDAFAASTTFRCQGSRALDYMNRHFHCRIVADHKFQTDGVDLFCPASRS